MAKKELGLDSVGIQKTLTLKNYLGDAAGMIGFNGFGVLTGMLTYFYTDKAGLAAAAVGTFMLAARIFDAITDIGMGYLVERTKSRFGKARPWFLWIALPALVTAVALYCIPISAAPAVKTAYAFITYFIMTAIITTAINIPYSAFMAFVTRSPEERSKMGVFRSIFGTLIGMVGSIGLIPITNALGGDQRAWIITASVIAVVGALSFLIAFFSNKERYSSDEQRKGGAEKTSLFTNIKLLLQNKNLLLAVLMNFFMCIQYALSGSATVYYAKWIFKNENLLAVMAGIGIVPMAVGYVLTGPMVKKFGPAKAARIGLLIGVAGTVVRAFFPYNFVMNIVVGIFTGFGTIPFMSVYGALLNNTTEYNEWKTGNTMVGLTSSVSAFGSKLANGLGAALIGWVLAAGSYNPDLAEQGQAAINSILAICIWIPGILLLAIAILLRFYDLDAKYPQIVKDLEERRKASQMKAQ
jgi:GPH family glycoside/pentoside/hexuronide:cation symporter